MLFRDKVMSSVIARRAVTSGVCDDHEELSRFARLDPLWVANRPALTSQKETSDALESEGQSADS